MAEGFIGLSTDNKELQKQRLPDFAEDIRELVGEGGGLPPVEAWHPKREGDIDILITRKGAWLYQGEPMERLSVVRLLSKILRKDGDEYYLVSPAEKMKIQVEDAPFLINMLDVEGEGRQQKLHFSTMQGDCFTLSDLHPLMISYNESDEPSPYILVRHALNGLISRQVYYQLVELLVLDEMSDSAEEKYGLWSDDSFFLFQ